MKVNCKQTFFICTELQHETKKNEVDLYNRVIFI